MASALMSKTALAGTSLVAKPRTGRAQVRRRWRADQLRWRGA